jgi:type I restriction enzyme S subunit
VKAGWQTTPFEDCIEPVTYTTKIQRKDFLSEGAFPIVSQEEDLINGRWENETDLFKVEQPLVLFGDHTRSFKYVDFDFVLGADGVKILKPKAFLHPRYFYFQLQTAKLESLGYARHFRLLKEHSVSYPDFAEQHRIVTLLDEAFADIATAKTNAEKNLQNARALFISHLQSSYQQQGNGWTTSRIADIARHSLGKMLDKAKNRGDLKPYLRNLNVRWFDFDLSDVQEMKFTPEESDKYTAIKGDLLICEGGYPGRCAIWEDDEPIYFQKALHRVRFHNPLHSKWFVNYLYLMDQTGDLKNHFSGTGIQHFTGEALAKFTLPTPPDRQIQQLLDKSNQLEIEVVRLESIYRQKLTALDDLKKSLLHQAFNGQL